MRNTHRRLRCIAPPTWDKILGFHSFFAQKFIMTTMELKDIMKQRREILSLTQQDLAEMAQVGLATIKDIERGKGNPELNTVKTILEVLGIEIDYRVRQTI